jgi:hypothetical protein
MRLAFEKIGRPPHPQFLVQSVSDTAELLPQHLTLESFLQMKGFATKALA